MSITQLHTIPEEYLDLVDDLPADERSLFAADLAALTAGREVTRNDVIGLRIAGDPENNGGIEQYGCLEAFFHFAVRLVENRILTEDEIARYAMDGVS